jgi:hypothetical protein
MISIFPSPKCGRSVCLLLFVLLATIQLPAAAADEEPLVSFSYSVHSTIGLLTMEASTEVSQTTTTTAVFRVPNRGFSRSQQYTGDGNFSYHLIDADGEAGVSSELLAPIDWNGRHIYFFAFANPGGEASVRLAPLPENPDFRSQGAVVFGNYTQKPIAARLGNNEVRTLPGSTVWNPAVNAPDGMQTLIVKAENGEIRPIYRNLIPVRKNQRLFIMIVPGRNDSGERLLVVFDELLSNQ